MNQNLIENMVRLPFNRAVAQINLLVANCTEKMGAAFGEYYRNVLVSQLIRRVQGLA